MLPASAHSIIPISPLIDDIFGVELLVLSELSLLGHLLLSGGCFTSVCWFIVYSDQVLLYSVDILNVSTIVHIVVFLVEFIVLH